ncbi:MAG: TonB-dependent receptor [Panacagrimonas sp.]
MKNRLALSLMVALSAVPAQVLAQEIEQEPAPPAADVAATAETEALPTIPVDATELQDPPEVAPDTRNRVLQEIVVTAQKREENIQDVPISISAFSGEALDAKGIGDPKTLAQSIPGVTYGETVNFSIIYVRGVGTDAFLPDSDLSVAMYMDGIYFPFANGLSQSLGAIERVEVLKGPQGTLFGRNATGGAFNISSRLPSLDTPELQVSTGYGKFDTLTTRVYGNVPLTDTLAANVSLTYNKGENYYDGTRGEFGDVAGEPFPDETERGARMRVRWQPSDWMDLTVTGIKHEKEGLASSAMPNIQPSTVTSTLFLATQGQAYEVPPEYRVDVDVPSYFSLDNEVAYAQLGLHPSWFDVKVLGSYQKVETDNNYDFDGTRAPFITFDARGQFAEVTTAEVQLISNKDWGWDWLEWVLGYYYLDQDVGFPLNRLSVGSLDVSDGVIGGIIPLPQGGVDFYESLADLGIPLTDGFSLALISLQKVEASAFFGQGTVHFTDWMYLTLGGRFQEETRKVVESSVGAANIDGSITPVLNFGQPEKDDTNFSPKVVLGFKPWDDTLFYGSWSKGFKSGTFNTVNVYNAPEYVLPEEVTSFELGSKITFIEGQMQLNAAAFTTEIENQQVQFVSLLAGGAVQLENAGQVTINGAEMELQYRPDWNTGLFMVGSVTYLDSTYDKYSDASAYDEPFGLYNFRNGDFTGNRTVRTPEWSGNFGVNYLLSFSHGDLELGASSFFSSDLFFQASNSEASRQKAYQTVDAQVSYLHNGSQVRITLLGRNLSDERYALTQFHTDAGVQEFLAPPRAFGVRLDWTFK